MFKIGDKVKLKSERGNIWNLDGLMDEYIGKVVTISQFIRSSIFGIEEDSRWTFMISDIEKLVNDVTSQTIEIRQKKNKVSATLFDEDGNYIRHANARCNPNDEFNFDTGRDIAVGRLLDLQAGLPINREVERQAKVGEWVKVVDADSSCANEYKNGDVLQIVKPDFDTSLCAAYYKNERRKYLNTYEYVVLENYKPESKPESKDYTGKRVKIVNTDRFKAEEHKELNSYIGKVGTIRKDYMSGYRFVINFDVKYMNAIDKENGCLRFQFENVEFID